MSPGILAPQKMTRTMSASMALRVRPVAPPRTLRPAGRVRGRGRAFGPTAFGLGGKGHLNGDSLRLGIMVKSCLSIQYLRSEERRVGKECRSRWWTDHEKKNRERRQ